MSDATKGRMCSYKATICQTRNDCEECQIYLDAELCPVCGAHLANWLEMMGERHTCEVRE